MAYTSFTLRKTSANEGSALRRTYTNQDSSNPGGSGTAVFDSGLRSDNYFPAVPSAYLESTFSADIYQRDQIELQWRLDTAIVQTPSSEDYEPYELIIRAHNDGEPLTADDGFSVLSITYENYLESFIDTNVQYIQEGKWVYYSMFVMFMNNTGDAYTQKVAELSIQVPRDFGSTDSLWARIPEYYRNLDVDYANNTAGYQYDKGPLYRFVDLFGWELDKVRTTIYDTMRISDPEVIHSSAINSLAKQVGIEFNREMLGTSKLRAVLNSIGTLRRTKGTIPSIESYISALSGCGVSTTTETTINGLFTTFDVHPHRVNLFDDPFFDNAFTNNDTVGPIYRKWSAQGSTGSEHGWGVYVAYSSTPTSSPTITVSGGTVTVTLTPKSGATAQVIIYPRKSFVYNNNLTYYGSAVSSHDYSMRFINSSTIASGLETSGSPSVTFADSWNTSVAESSFPKFYNPIRKVVATIPSTSTVSTVSVVPAFVFNFTLPASGNTTLTFSEPLFEYKHSHGDFFTGSEPLGGFIPVTGTAGVGTYDYHWGANAVSTANNDFSYYTLDFYRSKKITEYIIRNYVAPVTLEYGIDYEINWDVLE